MSNAFSITTVTILPVKDNDALPPEGEDAASSDIAADDSGEGRNGWIGTTSAAPPALVLAGNNLRTFDWDAKADEDNILLIGEFVATGSELREPGTVKIWPPLPSQGNPDSPVVCMDIFPEGPHAARYELDELLPVGTMAYIEAIHSTTAFQGIISEAAEETWGEGVRRYFSPWAMDGDLYAGDAAQLWAAPLIADDDEPEPETGEEPEPTAPSVIIEESRRLGERGPWRDLGGFLLQADDMYEGVPPAPGHLGVLIPPPDQHERRPRRIYVRFHPDDPSVEEIEISEGKVVVLAHEPGLPPDGDYLYGVVSELDTSTLTGCSLLGLSNWGAHGVIEANREARLLIADRANRPFQTAYKPAAPPFPPPKPEAPAVRRCVDCGSQARKGGDRCRPCEGRASPLYEQARLEAQRLRKGQKGLLRQLNYLVKEVRELRQRLAEAEAKNDTVAGLDE